MQEFVIFFIDDELNSSKGVHANARVELVQQLNTDSRFNVESFHPVDFMKLSGESKIKLNPDLIIIDYKLGGGGNTENLIYPGTGYTMTSYCKENYPDVPCYLISHLINDESTVSEHYDKKLSHVFLTKEEGRNALFNDCQSYRKIKLAISQYKGEDLIKSVLNVPKEEFDALKTAIPSDFLHRLASKMNDNITDSDSLLIKFTKWVNSILLVRKGPLIDKLELATLLGINVDFFENGLIHGLQLKSLFYEAKYTGVFFDTSPERWWAQKAYNIAIQTTKEEVDSETWKSFPQKHNIPEEHLSRCVICNEKYPETVAIDKIEKGHYACHWACCIGGEPSDDIIGFDPLLYLNI